MVVLPIATAVVSLGAPTAALAVAVVSAATVVTVVKEEHTFSPPSSM